ncbi:MAG: DUF4345 domain-containing protein, partial [Devosia sp.]
VMEMMDMRSEPHRNYPLRGALAIVGAVIVFLGLNVGFGGIQTLGWQGGSAPFLSITDASMFAVRDNHIRFIGGVWLALGLLMLAGSIALQRLRAVLVALTAMIFVGGLTRLGGGDLAVLLRPDVVPSVLFEIALVPLLGLWIAKAEQPRI